MKKIILLAALLLPMFAQTLAGGNVPKSKITSFIYDCQRYEGVEVVQLGGLATMALRASIRVAASDDPEVRDLLKLVTGIKRISDLLIETRDGNELMQIYGIVDDHNGTVRDFVMHTPSEASLICIFGSIPIERLARIVSDND